MAKKKQTKSLTKAIAQSPAPLDYSAFLKDLKFRIQTAQLKAAA